MGDLNALHPFREGNGRTQRAFCSQLARHGGHQIRWALMDPRENVAASRASLRGDNTALHELLGRLVDRPDPSSVAPQPRSPS
jgi:cell filamentation protein